MVVHTRAVSTFAAFLVVSLAAAIATDARGRGGSDRDGVGPTTVSEDAEATAIVRDIERRFRLPEMESLPDMPEEFLPIKLSERAALPPSVVHHFESEGDALRPRFDRPGVKAAPSATYELPSDASHPFSIADTRTRLRVTMTLLGARPSAGRVAAGHVLYPNAVAENAHLLVRAAPDGVEQYAAFHKAPAQERLRFRFTISDPSSALRLVDDVLEVLDSHGAPRLRVAPPAVLSENGAAAPAKLLVEDCPFDSGHADPWGRVFTPVGARQCTLVIDWSGKHVTYPALVDPYWQSTASDMLSDRYLHTATLLRDGRVLIVGGVSSFFIFNNTVLRSSEIYDWRSQTFTFAGQLPVAVAGHAATLLEDGRVAVTGGLTTGFGATAAVQVFDPVLFSWNRVGNLQIPRSLHTASLLGPISGTIGTVMVAGGSNAGGTLSTYETFNSRTNVSRVIGTMQTRRAQHTATTMSNGNILVVGGRTFNAALKSSEIFNPALFQWTSQSLQFPRIGHSTTLLQDGTVLAVGGVGATSAASAELFNGAWAQVGQPIVPHTFHAAALVANQQVLIAGGRGGPCFLFGFLCPSIATSELYDPLSGFFHVTSDLNAPRQLHVMTSLADKSVLATGGFQVSGLRTLSSAEIRVPQNDQLTSLSTSQPSSGYNETSVAAVLRCEPAAAASNVGGPPLPCGRLQRNFVVGYNSANAYDQNGLHDFGGWSTFDFATGWEQHGQNNEPWGLPEGGTSDGSTFSALAGDPVIVATGWPGQVLYITLGNSQKNPNPPSGGAVDVVMALSADGGHSFGKRSVGVMKNGQPFYGSFHVLTDGATGRGVDQPKASSDLASHVVYVWWTQTSPRNCVTCDCTGVDGHCSTEEWVYRIHFNQDGSFETGVPGTSGGINQGPKDNIHNVWIASDCDNGVDNCIGGRDRVWLTYPDPAFQNKPGDPDHTCPTTELDRVLWYIAESGDVGRNWGTDLITISGGLPYCVTLSSRGNGSNRNFATMAFDKTREQRVVAISKSVFNFDHSYAGTRIFVYGGPNGNPIPWHVVEIAPICPDNGPGCDGSELFGEQFGQSLAVQPAQGFAGSVVAAAWHDARVQPFDTADPPVSMWFATSFAGGLAGTWQTGFLSIPTDGPSGNNIPWIQTNTQGNTAWGDYEWMVADPWLDRNAFYATWGDNRFTGSSQVFGKSISAF